MLRESKHINAFASDDNHNYPICSDSFGGWVMVNTQSLTHDNIINALLSGNYYSSSGPRIHGYGIKDNTAWVDCSNVEHVNFIAGNDLNAGWSIWGTEKEDTLTHAELQLKGSEEYVRIECVDKWGKIAWTNPMYND